MPNQGQLSWVTPVVDLGKAQPYVVLADQKTSGTSGGTFTSGAWQPRTINTIVTDTHSIARLQGTTQFVLPAGRYRSFIVTPAAACDRHQARLQNITTGETLILGVNSYAGFSSLMETSAIASGFFRVNGSDTLEVQHRCQTTRATDGFGYSASWGTEVYTVAQFWRDL